MSAEHAGLWPVLGMLTVTSGVQQRLNSGAPGNNFSVFMAASLTRHISRDWGELGQEDKETNEEAVRTGLDRVFSSYTHKAGLGLEEKLWIITEADRSVTTILLPDEH